MKTAAIDLLRRRESRRQYLRVILLILAAYAFAGWNDAKADAEYYKLTNETAATASRKGDELFAELVTNLPNSAIVNAPQSAAMKIYGSCSLRQYTKWGITLFSEKWRGGYPVATYGPDNLLLKVLPNTPVAALFDKECAK